MIWNGNNDGTSGNKQKEQIAAKLGGALGNLQAGANITNLLTNKKLLLAIASIIIILIILRY